MREIEPAQSRIEELLQNMLGASYVPGPAQSRVEKILANMLGANYELEPPQSRIEALLLLIYERGGFDAGQDH